MSSHIFLPALLTTLLPSLECPEALWADFQTQVKAEILLASMMSLTSTFLAASYSFCLGLGQDLCLSAQWRALADWTMHATWPFRCVVTGLEGFWTAGPHEKGARGLGFLFSNMH